MNWYETPVLVNGKHFSTVRSKAESAVEAKQLAREYTKAAHPVLKDSDIDCLNPIKKEQYVKVGAGPWDRGIMRGTS